MRSALESIGAERSEHREREASPREGRPVRVLAIAELCNPSWASVPLVGYNLVNALTRRPDLEVTVVTHERNRSALDASPVARRAKVHYINNDWIQGPLYRVARWFQGDPPGSWTTGAALGWPGYMAFEFMTHRLLGGALRGGEFDLVHRITPLTPTYGSPIARLTEVPMLLGPINGGLPWPSDYPGLRLREREWFSHMRPVHRCLPYYRSTYRRLAGVIAASRHTASELPRSFQGRTYFMPENGIDPDIFPLAEGWPGPGLPFRFIAVARLTAYKGVDLILEAMARSPALRSCRLGIIGEGPERGRLEASARRLGLEHVEFLGWLGQPGIAEELRRSQAFVLPSLREFGGGAVLEAMACGLPAIIVDYGGPAELVTPESALAVPMAPREPLIADLTRAMEQLAGDPERCASMARAASRHVRDHFTWDSKAAKIAGIYRDLTGVATGGGA